MKKIWKCLLILLAVLLFAVVVLLYVRPAILGRTAGKNAAEESPTAAYSEQMPTVEEMLSYAEDLVNMGPRKPGTSGGEQAKQYVLDRFTEFGLDDVQVIAAESDLWECAEQSLMVDGQEMPCYGISKSFDNGEYGSFSTPDGGLSAPIIYVGDGDSRDFKNVDVSGKIVVAEVRFSDLPLGLLPAVANLFYDPENSVSLSTSIANPYSANTFPNNYYNALNGGAVGFVGILRDYFDSCEFNNEDYSYIGGQMRLPGVWVSASAGDTIIKSIAAHNGESEAVLTMRGHLERVKTGAVVGFLYGQSEDTLMIHSHYDSVTPGAVEDASGTSVVLALAKFYSQIPAEERQKTLMFVEMDTHFSDYDTHDALIAEYMQPGHSILCDLCIEHIAEEYTISGRDLVPTGNSEFKIILASSRESLTKITSEEVARHQLARTAVVSADLTGMLFGGEIPTDADMFFEEGVPVISLIAAPVYLYDNQDTMDKIDADALRPTAETYADIIWRLDDLDAEAFAK